MYLPRAALVIACLGLAGPAWALAPAEVFARLSPTVAVLEIFDEAGQRQGAFSATAVAPERLVAVCDVLETAASLRVVGKSASIEVRIAARDRERNLCLLTAPGLSAAPALRVEQPLPVGSRVFAISNALGLGIGISEGVVSGIRSFPPGDYVQFTAPISPGSEGGALVDDRGRLVAIIDYRRRDGQNVNFASTAAWIDGIESRAAADAGRLKRFDQAMALLKQQQWRELQSQAEAWTGDEPRSVDAWRFVIAAAKGRGDAGAELAGWRSLYGIDASSGPTGIGLGRALLSTGKAREAMDLARQLLAAHREDAAAWLFQGLAQQALGQGADAEQSYQRAVQLDPWQIEAYRHLALLAQERGEHRTAIAVWRQLSGLYSNQLWTRIGLTRAYLSAGRPERAWSSLGQVADGDADSPLVWYWRGITLARLGCPEQAIAAYRQSLDRQLPNAEWAWGAIGLNLHELHRFPEAIAALRQAVTVAPGSDAWRYQLAIALKDGGRADEALAITADLVARKPEEASHWRQHGFVQEVLGRAAEAIPAMERSLQIEPQQPKLWAALIATYQIAGRREDARRAYERLRGMDGATAETSYRTAILPFEERGR